MTPLGKGRLALLLVLLVATDDSHWTHALPVGEPQLDGAPEVLPSSGTSDFDVPTYDYTDVVGDVDYEVYPEYPDHLLQPNDTAAGVESRGGSDFLEMDPNLLGDVLEFLDVESLDQHDPALEKPGGLKVMTQGGDQLKVTKGQDGSISVNGSVVDGVMSLPDGTEIYTLERFLKEHRHLMDEAFRHLAVQSKSLEQTNGRNYVTKPQLEGLEAEEKFEVNDQISRPASPDLKTPMPFSLSVSEVTEISTRTSPPEMTVQKSIPGDMTVTEARNEDFSPGGPTNVMVNKTDFSVDQFPHNADFSADQFPHDGIYHAELGPDYPAYEDMVYDDVYLEAATQNGGIPEYHSYDDALYSETVSERAVQGKEISEYPVKEEATYEDAVNDETSSSITAVSEGTVNKTQPDDEVAFQETHPEVLPVTHFPLDLDSHHSEPLTEDLHREAKAVVSETNLNQLSPNTAEKINVMEDVTEQVPIQTTMSALDSNLNDEDLIPVTEPIKLGVLVPVPVLNDDEPVILTEYEESITAVLETDLTDAEAPVTEHFFEAEDPLPVTELGPFPSEVILEDRKNLHANETSVHSDQEMTTELGRDILDSTQPDDEILSDASIDSYVRTEHPDLPHVILGTAAEKALSPNSLPTSELVKDDRVAKLTSNQHIDVDAHDINLEHPANIASEGQESSAVIVPAIPPVISEIEILPIIDVWGFALLEQENDTKINLENNRAPKTVLTPEFHEFINVVPQDSWHPLYASSPESKALRKDFVLDYLLDEPILPEDPRLAAPEGLTASNIGGKELSFRRDSEGYLNINGIPVLDFSRLSDGTVTYTLATFLFDHRALVKEALLRHSRLRLPDLTVDVPGPPLAISDVSEVLPIEPTIPAVTETMSTGAIPPSGEFPVTEAIGSVPADVPEIPTSLANEESSLLDTTGHPVPIDPSFSETGELPASRPQGDSSVDSHTLQRTLPFMPETVVMGSHSSLLQFWKLSLEDQERLSVPVNNVGPRTLLNPDFLVMETLVPEGLENPLLSNKTENKALRAELVLDYLIPQSVNLQDLKAAPDSGLHVINFNGKDLVFEGKFRSSRGQESRLTVNGVDVTKIVTLADGTQVFELTDLLFDHRQRISELAHQDQGKSSHQQLPGPTATSDGLKEPILTVPPIPLPAAINPTASQTHLWAFNQFYQDKYHTLEDARFPKTILSPAYKKMENLVPNDDRHPLYENDSQRSVDLRAEFLLNYLILESVDERGTRITQPEGFTVENLQGKNITFMMDDQGNLNVNGVLVEKVDTLDNDMKVYHLADFLFDHSEIQSITDEYKSSNIEKSLSQQADEAALSELPVTEVPFGSDVDEGRNQSSNYVPDIPEVIEDSVLSLINLWRYSLRHQDLSFLIADQKIPMTVLSPINDKMQNMVPENSQHPLYDESPESVALRTEFLLDYLALDSVTPNDTRIAEPEGLTILNLNQRELVFSNDVDGNLMVSGIPVEDVQTLPDGTQIYTLSDFLFDHKVLVNEALRKLSAHAKNTEVQNSGVTDQTVHETAEGQV